MTHSTHTDHRLDQAAIDRQLREALQARADRLGVDPASIASPTPGALIARGQDGQLLRVDFRARGGPNFAGLHRVG